MNEAPGFWMNETGEVLRPAVEAYLRMEPLTAEMIGAMKAYLRQWMAGMVGDAELDRLTEQIDAITSREGLEVWFDRAWDLDVDPL